MMLAMSMVLARDVPETLLQDRDVRDRCVVVGRDMREWTRRQTRHVCLRIREQIFNRHFRSGPNFLYYYYSVQRQSFSLLFSFRSTKFNHFRYRYRELRPFLYRSRYYYR